MLSRSLGACLLVSVAAAPLCAQAAEPASKGADASTVATTVQELVVTAQRREERLFDVPISMTALTGDTMEKAGVINGRDLTTLTPGLNAATQGFAFQPSIRGVTSTSTTLGDEPNVAIYVDNVYSPFQMGNSFNLGSVERIEVLKGPQGTLFGRNATGGAIRIITASPTSKPTLKASADNGFDLGSREVNVYGSMGTDKVAASLSVYGYRDDGYVDNLTPGQGKVADTNQFTARGKVLWHVTDRVDVTAGLDTTNYNSSASFATAIYHGVSQFKTLPGVMIADSELNKYKVALNVDPYVKTLAATGFVRAEWRGDKVTLSSTTSEARYQLKALLDSDRTNLNLSLFPIFLHNRVWTQEFDAVSTLSGPFNYSLGAFIYRNKGESPTATSFSQVIDKSWAGFGELYYDFNEHLRLIGGYRYTSEEKDGFARSGALSYSRSPSWNSSTYRAVLQYKFNADNNVYLSYNTGFKSGVISIAPTAIATQQVSPEEITAYEAGVHSRVGPVTMLLAAFHYDYTNIQVQINNITALPPAPTTLLQNAASATIDGAEFQAGSRFGDHWSGQVGVSYIPTAKYDSYKGGLVLVPKAGGVGATLTPTDLSGARLIRTPKFTFDASGTYEAPLFNGKFLATATYFYSDSFAFVAGGAVSQKPYATLNGRVSWTAPNDRVTFSLWARNLTDKFYYLQMGANTSGFSASYAQPRVIGIGVSYSY